MGRVVLGTSSESDFKPNNKYFLILSKNHKNQLNEPSPTIIIEFL